MPWLSSPVRASRRLASISAARLAGQADLGGPEDDVQHDRQDGGRRDRHRDDVAPGRVDRGQDRSGVPVDLEDRRDAAVDLDRDVLLEDLGPGREVRGRGLARVGRLDGRGDRLALDRLGDVVVEPEVPATELGDLAEQDRAIAAPRP